MTNKEAIEILKGIYPSGAYNSIEEHRLEVINMAIAALANTQRMTEALRTEYEKGRYDMREEMMKEAVDANMGHFFHAGDSKGRILFCKDDISHIKTDTKVKLIIVKED